MFVRRAKPMENRGAGDQARGKGGAVDVELEGL